MNMTMMWRYNANVGDFVSDYNDFVSDYNDFNHEDLIGNRVNFAGVNTVADNWIDSPVNPRHYLTKEELNAYAVKQAGIDVSFNYVLFRKNILNKVVDTRQMRRAAAWEFGITR